MIESLGLSFVYSVLKDMLRFLRSRRRPCPETIQPNIRVSEAIDFIVNDSRAQLHKPPPPKIDGYGPGTILYVSGVEHQDARRMLNEKLISGEMKSCGLRQIRTHVPNQFEVSAREIPSDYWNNMQLDFQSCLYYRGPYPQTMKIPGRDAKEHEYWADVKLSKEQLHQFWPPKSLMSRTIAKLLRRPRIAHTTRIDIRPNKGAARSRPEFLGSNPSNGRSSAGFPEPSRKPSQPSRRERPNQPARDRPSVILTIQTVKIVGRLNWPEGFVKI